MQRIGGFTRLALPGWLYQVGFSFGKDFEVLRRLRLLESVRIDELAGYRYYSREEYGYGVIRFNCELYLRAGDKLGKQYEIYLSDFHRTALENLKTIGRQPFG